MENATKSRSPYAVKMPSFDAPEEADLPVGVGSVQRGRSCGSFHHCGIRRLLRHADNRDQPRGPDGGVAQGNGIRDVDVHADGFHLTLVGTVRVQTQVAVALAIAHSVEGVADVNALNVLYVPPPADIDVDLAVEPLVFSWDTNRMAVSGTVSDQATHDVIVESLAELWPTVNKSGLVVKDGIEPEKDWLPSIMQVIGRVGEDLEQGLVIANSGSRFVLVNGELHTRAELVAVRSDVRNMLLALTFVFTSGLTIAEEGPPVTDPPVAGSSPATTTTTLAPEVIELQETLDELIEGKVVEFDFASAVITREGRNLLDEVLEALVVFPDVGVEIGGHTDDVGTPDSNLLLSRLRAASVLSYLIDNGQDATRFVVIGYGEMAPLDDNATAAGRARNRRIEFTALSE